MPCGGIYPVSGFVEKGDMLKLPCWMCDKPGCQHFCEEWDTTIHARCVPAFLQTPEGEIVIHHGHQVLLDFSLEEEGK